MLGRKLLSSFLIFVLLLFSSSLIEFLHEPNPQVYCPLFSSVFVFNIELPRKVFAEGMEE